MDPIITALTAYAGKNTNVLIGQIFLKMENQGLNVMEGVKGKRMLPKLNVAAGIKPYTGIHSPVDRLTFSDRSVDPQLFQLDGTIEPLKFEQTYFKEMKSKSVTEPTIPFANFIWMKVIESITDEIVKKAIYKGIQGGVNVDKAYNINDGFEKRITDLIAGGKAPVTTGAITAANAVTKFETFFNDCMTTYEALRGEALTLYCSNGNLDNYIDHYRTLFQNDPANWSDGEKPLYLKKNKGKVQIKAVDWLGSSERILLSKEDNLVVATDSISNLSKIKMVEDVYTTKYGITSTIDTNFADSEILFYNDQA